MRFLVNFGLIFSSFFDCEDVLALAVDLFFKVDTWKVDFALRLDAVSRPNCGAVQYGLMSWKLSKWLILKTL